METDASAGRTVVCFSAFPALQRILEFERLAPGSVCRALAVTRTTGGKAVNVARAARRLGAGTRLVGFAGGAEGAALEAALDAEGLPHRLVRTAAATRTCQTLLERDGGRVTELVEEAVPPPPEDWQRAEEAVAEACRGAGALVLAGNLPRGCPAGFYAGVMKRVRRADLPVLLDTGGEALRLGAAAGPFLAKANAQEAEAAAGRALPDEAARLGAAEALRAAGAGRVLITDGGGPTLTAGPEGARRLVPPRVAALNPVGSGDTLTAGLAVALLGGAPFAEAAAFGTACASAQCLTRMPAEFDPAHAAELAARVRSEPVRGAAAGLNRGR